MRNVFEYYEDTDCLEHHGIKGMKWGIRRFQNSDGTLTQEGVDRYRKKSEKLTKKFNKAADLSDQYWSVASDYNKQARRFLQTPGSRHRNAKRSSEAMGNSLRNSRKAVKALNKLTKIDNEFGRNITNLDENMIRRGYELAERHNNISMYNVNQYYMQNY